MSNKKQTTKNEILNRLSYLKSKHFYEICFFIAILTGALLWLIGIFYGGKASSQFSAFFADCNNFLADMVNVVGYSSQKDPYNNTMYTGFGEKAYPPLIYILTYFFSRLVNMQPYYEANHFLAMYTEPKFLIIFIFFIILQQTLFYETVRIKKDGSDFIKCSTAFAVLFSMPMMFSVERGNTVIAAALASMVYIFYYDSESRVKRELALISLAVAAALKITPAVLGILLIYNKQWKDIIRIIVYGIIICILPFFSLNGGLANIPLMLRNISINLNAYSSDDGCTLLACILRLFNCSFAPWFRTLMKFVTYVFCAIFALYSFLSKVRWEKILSVVMILIILPSHSAYYCTLYMIPAMVEFLNEKEHTYSDFLIFVSFLMIMQPFQIPYLNNIFNYHTALLIIAFVLFFRCFVKTKKKKTIREKLQE